MVERSGEHVIGAKFGVVRNISIAQLPEAQRYDPMYIDEVHMGRYGSPQLDAHETDLGDAPMKGTPEKMEDYMVNVMVRVASSSTSARSAMPTQE